MLRAALCLIAGVAACSAAPGPPDDIAAAPAAAVTAGTDMPASPGTDPLPAAAVPAADPPPRPATQSCGGVLRQGGLVICRGAPGDVFRFGQTALTAGPGGTVQYGLARTAPARLAVTSRALDTELEIAPRSDEVRTVPGLDCDKVDARTPAQKAHAAASWQKKQAAFATFAPGEGALAGFRPPTDFRPSSPFGPVRRYTGVSKTSGAPCDSESVHLGQDYATPTGTPVRAPAPGTVTLADPDLYYEGGTIFLDHGEGLVSVFMHLSAVEVAAGDAVAAGEVIGASGNTGRSSGPHLHWGVKWRNPSTEDRSGDVYIDPALLLMLQTD